MALVSMTDSITSLPAEFKTAMEIVSLWTSIPIYLVLSIKRVLLSGGFEANTQNLLQRGALLYCVLLSEYGFLPKGRIGPHSAPFIRMWVSRNDSAVSSDCGSA